MYLSTRRTGRIQFTYIFVGSHFQKLFHASVIIYEYIVIIYEYFTFWNIFQIWWADNTTFSTLQNPSLFFFTEWLGLYTSTTFRVVLQHFKTFWHFMLFMVKMYPWFDRKKVKKNMKQLNSGKEKSISSKCAGVS